MIVIVRVLDTAASATTADMIMLVFSSYWCCWYVFVFPLPCVDLYVAWGLYRACKNTAMIISVYHVS